MRIRPVVESDIPVIARLEQENFSDAWSEKGLAESFARPGTFFLAAEENAVIQGYVILYYVLDEGEITRIAVSQTARRRGAAASLLEEIKQICMGKGIQSLFLEVRSSNTCAISLYEKFGFIKDGMRKRFYKNPEEDAVLMSTVLK